SDGAMFDCVVVGVPGNCTSTDACSAIDNHMSYVSGCSDGGDVACCTAYGEALCDPTIVPEPNKGRTKEAPGKGGCPAGMARVDPFCVDRYEASLVRMDNGASWSPYFNPGSVAVRAVSVGGVVPQAYISGDQADQACVNAGKRLCTDAEWIRVCE